MCTKCHLKLNEKVDWSEEYDPEIPQSNTQTNPWHREEEPHNMYSNQTSVKPCPQSWRPCRDYKNDNRLEVAEVLQRSHQGRRLMAVQNQSRSVF